MSNLLKYLDDNAMSQRAFAKLIGVDASIVSRLARSEIRPSLDLAFAIERETSGAVPAVSWVPLAEAPEDPSPAITGKDAA